MVILMNYEGNMIMLFSAFYLQLCRLIQHIEACDTLSKQMRSEDRHGFIPAIDSLK